MATTVLCKCTAVISNVIGLCNIKFHFQFEAVIADKLCVMMVVSCNIIVPHSIDSF